MGVNTRRAHSQAIKEKREYLGISQESFARMVGVSVRTVGRWEEGASSPSNQSWSKIRKVFREQGS